ncbi:hypothetical protein JD276_04305 [Leucobacter sp. CSA1]|uniref:Uncharacterized protein n=1 Tax=Leucobacter chromiisoli TaxID=2796471 RepID=A0A934Q819_9MICO|nr:hypothetical protein [Leucobacter chromiisoli]MBK0418252.1 hypothetical protein [Leucobacter chromiisoli]
MCGQSGDEGSDPRTYSSNNPRNDPRAVPRNDPGSGLGRKCSGPSRKWSGDRIGRLSLRLDAAYCTILGAGVALGAPRIATALPMSSWLLAALGLGVVAWAGLILVMLSRLPLRTALRLVMIANLFAAAAVAAVSTTGAALLVVLAVLAVAADITLFAGSQAFALRRLRRFPDPHHPRAAA